MNENERLYEIEKLKTVMFEIECQIQKNSDKVENYLNYQIEANKLMWDEVPAPSDLDDIAIMNQYIDEIKVNAKTREFYLQLVKRLLRMKRSPYFGRIDFKETGEVAESEIYIGIANLENGSGDIIVYDWRAPVSSMFYDYETGEAQYKCPAGIITGEVTLKRQYKILDGKINYMFNSNIKIDDEILQRILSKSADNKMKTIVTTIQREQNRIIRDESHKLLMVHGPAGSGKTSIALHRVAFLLYRYKDTISPENIVIFSPNQVFSDYISNVLPELGEENTYRTTFFEYAQKNINKTYNLEDMNDQMEYLLTAGGKDYNTRVEAIKLKSSELFKNALDKYILYMKKEGFKFCDIVFGGKIVISESELSDLFRKDYAFLPIMKRFAKIRQRFNYILKPFAKERYEEILEENANSGKYVNKKEMKARSRITVKNEMQPLIENINKMTSINAYELYYNLFRNMVSFKSLLSGVIPDSFNDICRFTLNSLDKKNLYYEDVFPVLYLKGLLGDIPSMSSIKHVIIDEAQDYTLMQYEIIKQLFKNSSFTMLADLNQSINPYLNIGAYKNIAMVFNDIKKINIKLNKTYRSTREITAFCNSMLDVGEEVEYVNRPGKKPAIIECLDENSIADLIKKDLFKEEEKDINSTAVICRTDSESRRIYQLLKKYPKVHLITKDDTKYSTGIVVVPSYLAKGLEFDRVIVFNAGSGNYISEQERKLFYTVCTRALHELYIYYCGKITPFIEGISKELYNELQAY